MVVYALLVGIRNILLSEVKVGYYNYHWWSLLSVAWQAGTSEHSSVVIVSNTSHGAKGFVGRRVSGHPRGHALLTFFHSNTSAAVFSNYPVSYLAENPRNLVNLVSSRNV